MEVAACGIVAPHVRAPLPSLRSGLRSSLGLGAVRARRVLLHAPPGAGKSTSYRSPEGRRMARAPQNSDARAAPHRGTCVANRMAQLLGEPVGGLVATYPYRDTREPDTRIEVVTEGFSHACSRATRRWTASVA